MKKILLSLLAILALSTSSMAQYNQSGFYLGVKAGVNLSNVIGEYGFNDVRNNTSKAGFVGGVFAEYDIFKWLGVGVDVLYSRQGSLTKIGEREGLNSATIELRELHQYINLPVMVRFTPVADFEIYAGIQPSYMVSAIDYFKINDAQESTDVTDQTYNFEFSVPVGLSYTFADRLKIDLRYNVGVTDIYRDVDWVARNSTFSITLGYKFEL